MSQQHYLPPDFNVFSPVHPNSLPHSNQSINPFNYDPSNYNHDPYAPFDISKPIEQYQYTTSHPPQPQPPQPQPQSSQQRSSAQSRTQFHTPLAGPGGSQFNIPTQYASQNGHQQAGKAGHRPSTSISSEDSLPTPGLNKQISLRAPKFDRTYTDALEDELYDESSSSTSHSVNSQAQISKHATPNYGFQHRVPSYPNGVYMDKSMSAPAPSQTGQRQQPQMAQSPQSHQMNGSRGANAGHVLYTQANQGYDPLGNQSEAQRLSSTAVADSVRRLQAPGRTTVSPREAFLDYPDSADFRERTLFSKSGSPYSQSHEAQQSSRSNSHHTETSNSNDDDYNGSEENQVSTTPMHYQNVSTLAVPETSRSTSHSTYQSAMYSTDVTADSGASSESEYDPTLSTRRASRSGGRHSVTAKTFACPDCGKRFEKAQPLQAHRRNSHGKSGGPPSLSQHKFSNTSHRCDYVDPNTGKTCNTVFSRP